MKALTALFAAAAALFAAKSTAQPGEPSGKTYATEMLDGPTVYDTEDAEHGAAMTQTVYDIDDAEWGAAAREYTYVADDTDYGTSDQFVTVQEGQNMTAPENNEWANVQAFLATIRRYESADSDDGYRMLYGGNLWHGGTENHPYFMGWPGVRLPDETCRGAGFGPGCITTAAGAYQFLSNTWQNLNMPDFSPGSQDAAAIALIDGRGALADVKAGRFAEAIRKCRKEWASMPDAGYGQPESPLAAWAATYESKGGTIA